MSLFSAAKVKAVYEMWQQGYNKFAIAMANNIEPEHLDSYMQSALKKHSLPAKREKKDNTGPNLFQSSAVPSNKAVMDLQLQPPLAELRKAWATYSNQKSCYGN
jgi:hypothetical protein